MAIGEGKRKDVSKFKYIFKSKFKIDSKLCWLDGISPSVEKLTAGRAGATRKSSEMEKITHASYNCRKAFGCSQHVEIFIHEPHESHRETHVRDIEHA